MQESTPQLTDILLQNPGLSLGAAVLFALMVAGLLVLISLKRPPSDESEDGPVTPPPAMAPPLAPVPERAPPEQPISPIHHEDMITDVASEPEVFLEVAQEQQEPEPVVEAVQEQQEESTPPFILDSESSPSVAGSPDTRPGLSLEELELPPHTESTREAESPPLPAASLVEADADSSPLEAWATGHEEPSIAPLPTDEIDAELIEENPITPEPAPVATSEVDATTAKSQRQQARLQQRQRIVTTKVQLLADQLMGLKEGTLAQMQQNMKLLAHRFAPVAWSDCSETVENARYRYQEATQLVRLANQLNHESDWPQQRIEMNLERAQNKIQTVETLAEQLDQRYQALIKLYREAKQTWNEQAQQYKNLRQALGENSPREKQLQRVNHELQRLKQYFDPDHLFVPQAFEDKQRTITHMLTLLTHPEGADATQEESMVGTP
jgi:acyl carrier protein phosphodiesterase